MRPVMILFAKAPVAGRVKTRLAEWIGAGAAAELHAAFVADMLATLESAAGRTGFELELHSDIPTQAWPWCPVPRRLQIPGDLGVRMYAALETALAAGRPRAAIVGGDAPTLPAGNLVEILQSPADVCLGPSEDGGYYVISCRRLHPRMFEGVSWSSPKALVETEQALARCGLTVARGPGWFDIDEPGDLGRLLRESSLPGHTAACLERLKPLLQ